MPSARAVAGLPPQTRAALTLRHLYQFLHATTHVETRVVNRGAERIAHARCGIELSATERMDAFHKRLDQTVRTQFGAYDQARERTNSSV